jgi:hypothetical protein
MPIKPKRKYRYPFGSLLKPSTRLTHSNLHQFTARLHNENRYSEENLRSQEHAHQLVNKRMSLLKTPQGQIIYLQELLKFSKTRNSLIRNISRAVEASQKKGLTSGETSFLTEIARRAERGNFPIVKRELEVEIRRKLELFDQAQKKKKIAQKKAVIKMNKGRQKSSNKRAKVRSRYLDKLNSSQTYINLSRQEKINYLKSKALDKSRSGPVFNELLKEVERLRREDRKEQAKTVSAKGKTNAQLLSQANKSKNIEIRRKLLRSLKSRLKKEGLPIPPEFKMIELYGGLTSIQKEKAKNYMKAFERNDINAAAKALKGTSFNADESEIFARKLRKEKGPVQEALFWIAVGRTTRADKIAKREESKGTRKNIFNAMNIRKRLK